MIFSVDLRDVTILLMKRFHLMLEGAVSSHLEMDMVGIMAAGEQKGLKERVRRVTTR